ncbi:MAG TPA: serine hydrolase [Flavisolibacter sp.]|nr:serine hydrolase [Flavisolibacter sp.]
MRYVTLLLLGVATCCTLQAQPKTDDLLVQILKTNTHPVMQQVLTDPMTYRCQVVYTRIDRDKNNTPSFTNYYFNYDPQLYFNPASTVKLPLALLALEKLNDLNQKGVNKYTTILHDSSYVRQTKAYTDSTSANGLPSIAHYIKRAFLISENDPYNRLYQFVGQQTIHRSLHSKGYTGMRISRQFAGYTPEQNRHSNQVRFLDANGKTIYTQPAAYNTDSIDFSRTILLGKAHMNRDDSLIQAPFDFTLHNNLSLVDLQQMLQSVLFPNSVPKQQRFRLTQDDYRFLYRWLSQYPSETDYPKYDTSQFYDSYVKFFFRDSTHLMPPHVRVFNKVGWSYGFLTDVSYVMDTKNKVEYMLTATLYVNSDGILNDGKYDYDTIGYPFLYQLGQTIYHHELQRKREYKPNFSNLQVKYDKRDPKDTRPALKEVDN